MIQCQRCGIHTRHAYANRWVHVTQNGEAVWLCAECRAQQADDARKEQREKKYSDPPPLTSLWCVR